MGLRSGAVLFCCLYDTSDRQTAGGHCPRTPAKEAKPLWTLISKFLLPINGEEEFCSGIPKGLCPLGGSLRAEPSASVRQRYHAGANAAGVDFFVKIWYTLN